MFDISATRKNLNQKEKKKKLACYYCDKILSHRISEHLNIMHAGEIEVARAFSKKGRERKMALLLLKNKGNFKHNIRVLKGEKQGLIVSRRPNQKATVDNDNYLPCSHCFGFFLKKDLWRHTGACPFLPAHKMGTKHFGVQASSNIILASSLGNESSPADLLKTLGTTLDTIGQVVLNDELVMHFGKVLLQKLGVRRKNDISQRMRQLGRLKMAINKRKGIPLDFSAIICGKEFDTVTESVQELVGTHTGEEGIVMLKKPGLALRLGHNLTKLAKMKFGLAIRNDDQASEKEAETFSRLIENEWCDKVSSVALATLKTNKFNKPFLLPLTEDLQKLKEYIDTGMSDLTAQLNHQPDYAVWRELAEITMSKVILLNKRRSSEASKLLMKAFINRPNWKTATNSDIFESLSLLEKKMFDRYVLLFIQGLSVM